MLSGTLRSAYVLVVERKIALIRPPHYALIGDSLTADCNWRWELGPLSVINLATGGSDIRDISHQVVAALVLKPAVLAIEGGINDILLDGVSATHIAQDFADVLREIPTGQRAVFTLIPFVSSRSNNAKIEDANSAIKALADARGLSIIDLNPKLAVEGIRKPEMTTDGIHLTQGACRIWAEEMRAQSNY